MNNKDKYKVVRLNCKLFPVISEELDELKRIGASLIKLEGDELLPEYMDVDALMVVSAEVKAEVIKKLSKCRIIARIGIGTDKIDIDKATANGILVTNVPDFCKSELAEHTMALILGVSRKIVQLDKNFRLSDWSLRDKGGVKRIADKKIGLIGFGKLARSVAHRSKAFDLKIYAYDPYIKEKEMEEFGVIKTNSIEEILKNCDYISLHLPLNDETFHLIDEEQLRMMKPTAILINVARGAIINEDALMKALSEGWIAGAGIDVFERLNLFEETPTKQYSPLFSLDNVIITPHSSAISDESMIEVKQRAASEVVRVLSGKWPKNCVNPKIIPRYPLIK